MASGNRVRVMTSHIVHLDAGTRVSVFLREGHRLLPFVSGRAFFQRPGVHGGVERSVTLTPDRSLNRATLTKNSVADSRRCVGV